jgi:hypothetical protein
MAAYLSDRFNLSQSAITPTEARAALSARGLDAEFVDEVATFLAACDAIRYAPGASNSLSPQRAAADVRRWIRRIERDAP